MNPLLLQSDSEDRFYHGMIELNRERHEAYCARHGYDYRLAPPRDLKRFFRLDNVREAMEEGYEFIVALDADACIADMSVDLQTALAPGVWLGQCVHPFPFFSNRQWHFNNGVMYWRACDESKAFIDRVVSFVGKAEYDQVAMNELLLNDPQYQAGTVALHQRWNQNTNHAASGKPVIAAFHGDGTPLTRLARMEKYAEANPWR